MTTFQRLVTWMSRYAASYRQAYNLPYNAYVNLTFIGNDDLVYVKHHPVEPDIVAIGEFWYNDVVLRRCVSLQPDFTANLSHTYVVTVEYDEFFDTSLQFIGPPLETLIPWDEPPPGPTLPTDHRGELLVNNGDRFVPVSRGPDGYALYSDSSDPEGVVWRNPTTVDRDGDLTWRSTWAAGRTYSTGDIVKRERHTYVCTTSHASTVLTGPPTGPNWELFVPAGADGTVGVPGPTGDVGPVGVIWMSNWNNLVTYYSRHAVMHRGTAYICVADGTITEPPAAGWSTWVLGGEEHAMIRRFPISAVSNPTGICSFRAMVTLDDGTVTYANSNNVDHAFRIAGLSLESGVSPQEIRVLMCGWATCSGLSFTPGTVVFLNGASGQLSAVPPETGFIAVIGRAVTADGLIVGLTESSIIL